MKLTDLDYFRAKNDIFFLVKGYYHPSNGFFAYPVFWPDKNGDRFQPKLQKTFSKNTSDVNNQKIFKLYPYYRHKFIPRNIPLVPKNEIIETFKPREKLKDFLKKEKGTIWFKIYQAISEIGGVPSKDIGIFGSYLIELSHNTKGDQAKDIDFVIYGIDNCLKIKNKIEEILNFLGAKHISEDHINYHQQKFGAEFNPRINSFKKTLARKWSAIQIAKGLLATIRFVYQDYEIPPNPLSSSVKKPAQVEGMVIDDFGTNFMPRVFSIQKNNKTYRVVTYFWGFQEAVKNGDRTLITGNLHQDDVTISIDSIEHGIKILN